MSMSIAGKLLTVGAILLGTAGIAHSEPIGIGESAAYLGNGNDAGLSSFHRADSHVCADVNRCGVPGPIMFFESELNDALNRLVAAASLSDVTKIFERNFADFSWSDPSIPKRIYFPALSDDNIHEEDASHSKPATLAMIGAGLLGLGLLRRRRKA